MVLLRSLSVLRARLRSGALNGLNLLSHAARALKQHKQRFTSYKFLSVSALTLMLAFSLVAQDAQAKRMGGGRSIGRQSHSFRQPHRATPPNQNQHTAARNQNTAQTPPAQPQRNRWLGPLAGIAAGLGIAALMSHLGLGGALGGMLSNLLVIGLIVLVAYWAIRLFKSRKNNAEAQNQHAYEPAFKPSFNTNQPTAPFRPLPDATAKVEPAPTTIEMPTSLPQSSSEATNFDNEAFLRAAKVLFMRLQAAWDVSDLIDIRKFTTTEMFAEIKLDLTERGTTANHTDVQQLDAELLNIDHQSTESLASVRFSGLIRETAEQTTAEPFSEIWNFTKDSIADEWKLAGIQQLD